MFSLVAMLEFKDLDTYTKVQTLIHLIIIFNMFLVINMTTPIHILIGIHNDDMISVISIPTKAKSTVTMSDMIILRKRRMVIHLHSK